jgi:hypothetical protein
MSNMFYKMVVLGATASTIYFTGSTLMGLFSKSGTFHMIEEGIKIIEADPECRGRVPPPFLVNGNHPSHTGSRRSRPIPFVYVNKEGREVSEMKFYLESRDKWALVQLKSVEGAIEELKVQFSDGKIKDLFRKPPIGPVTSFFKQWFNKLK